MSGDKLVMMANQIGKFFVPQRGIDPVAAIADHLRKFWDPRMRAAIVAHLEQGGADLDDPVRQAVRRLKEAEARS
ncbi:formate dehydrogenase delta subunit [Enhydrobacter aerosaccus]|uniref:Formate dehydrogenase delta subunit n=1 Tax=Enhydrobacter aerosaccus TaxID=225324 RepID=A0A1T4PNL1_9HYPH|nr:formate dehydrogenase subunit delta [Enhydrobacter aerosaccus]SJZ93122.1 formate dehydrogenase delta subunit [Enhydrobacter aerosaccus]